MSSSIIFDPPNYRLSTITSNFENTKSNHESIVERHWFNHQIEILVPHRDKQSKNNLKTNPHFSQLLEKITHPSLESQSFYYRLKAPLSIFTEIQFIEKHLKQGQFYAISYSSPIDHSSVFAITPEGLLTLVVDKTTYEKLGVEGHSSPFPPKNKRYIITINLLSPTFVPGKKFYERVQTCFKEKIGNLNCICSWIVDGKSTEIGFPSTIKKYKVNLETTSTNIGQIQIPLVNEDLIKSSMDKLDNQEDEEHVSPLTSFYDWIGVIATRSTNVFNSNMNPAISSYSLSCDFEEKVENSSCTSIKSTGIIAPHTVSFWLSEMRKLVREGIAPFAVVNVWGFSDSPISWGDNKHSFLQSGENDYTFVILPNDNYILYLSLSTHDTYS